MKAMILAAGLGTRMAPLTRCIAKPALPILDEPLVLRLVRDLARQQVAAAVVNAHAHPESLRAALREAPIPVQISPETPEPLGSGGGIRAARELLDQGEPFLVINGDMALELDVPDLLARHRRSGALATLALRDDPRKSAFGTIGYDNEGRVRRITSRIDLGGESGDGLFIGVQVMEPQLFEHMPAAGSFEIFPGLYVPALRSGLPIHTWLQRPEAHWCPVGRPAELLDANLGALRALGSGARCVARDATIEGELVPPVWVGAAARVEAGASLGPRAVLGAGARLPRGARAWESLFLPGATPPAGSFVRAIGFGDEVWCDA